MAGAFGYEAEHYEFSMKVGELSLFPALRETKDALVAAAGVSCQAQIKDGVGVNAYHPIQLVQKILPEGGHPPLRN
jgi:Fe-S oxidoreductase